MKIKKLIILIAFAITLVILIPLFLNYISNLLVKYNLLLTSQAEFSAWLGFYGSYIGGIISGIITLFGVLLGFNLERKKFKKDKYINQLNEFVEFEVYLRTRLKPVYYMLDDMKDFTYTKVKDFSLKNDGDFMIMERDKEMYEKYLKELGNFSIEFHSSLSQFISSYDIFLEKYKAVYHNKKSDVISCDEIKMKIDESVKKIQNELDQAKNFKL